MIYKNFLFIILSFSFLFVNGQGNFIYPNLELSISPEKPQICGTSSEVQVVCNQNEFTAYTWIYLSDLNHPSLTGNPVVLNRVGDWELVIETEFQGSPCSKSFYFQVYDYKADFKINTPYSGSCPSSTVELNISTSNLETYLWSTNESSSSILVGQGSYSVEVVDNNGCTGYAETVIDNSYFEDTDFDGVCNAYDCFPENPYLSQPGDVCNDFNNSTINDVIDENCICRGTPDPNNLCNGNDRDGDGVCDDVDPAINNPCIPNDVDSDFDGVCDIIDCNPNNSKYTYSYGDECDDNNASTIYDKINQDCICVGIPDPSNPCNGNDIDGDEICDDVDPFINDPCNGLFVSIDGDLNLCQGESTTLLTAYVEGGVSPYTYSWNNGDVTSSSLISYDPISTEVSLNVIDSKNCSFNVQVTIEMGDSPDSDGDGFCDDECNYPNFSKFREIGNVSRLLQIEKEEFKARQITNCVLNCRYETSAPEVCIKEYTSLSFQNLNNCSITNDDPVRLLAEYLDRQLENNQNGLLIISSKQDFCECPQLNDDLKILWNRTTSQPGSVVYDVGIWLIIDDSNNDGNFTASWETKNLPEDLDIGETLEASGIEVDYKPNNPIKINVSQFKGTDFPDFENIPLNYLGNTTNTGISDYANLPVSVINKIQTSAQAISNRWNTFGTYYSIKFITSADCIEVGVDQGDIDKKPSAQMAKEEYDSNSQDDFVIRVHYNMDNTVSLEAKINGKILHNDEDFSDIILENLKVAAKTDLNQMRQSPSPPSRSPYEVNELGSDDLFHFGIRSNVNEDEIGFWGISGEILSLGKETVTTAKIPEKVYRESGETIFKAPPMVAGSLDGCIEANPVGSMIQLVNLGQTYCEDEKTREGINKAILSPVKTTKTVLVGEWEKLSGQGPTGKEDQHHGIAKLSVTVVIAVFTGGGVAAYLSKLGKKADDIALGFKNLLKDFPDDLAHSFSQKVTDVITEVNSIDFLEHLASAKGTVGIYVNKEFMVDIWVKFKNTPGFDISKWQNVVSNKLPKYVKGVNDEFFDKIKEVFLDVNNVVDDKIKDFIIDLDIVDLVPEFVKKPNNVKAWNTLFDFPNLRINTTKLKAVDDFATAKNIDQSIIKTELNALPSHKEDLINGFEISNGTASYPTISNKGVIQTDGNLLGKLENGQFVPVGNAQAAGTMDYVVMQNGEILLGSKHTFLSQGDDVLAAGTVKFNVNGNGTLSDISNASGHYLPTPGEGMNFLRLFKSKGVNTQNTFLSIYEEGGTIFKQVHPNANARKLYE